MGASPSCALHHQREALTDADAKRCEPESAAACLKLVDERLHELSAGHAERMAQRDSPAVRIDTRIVVGKSKTPQHSERLARQKASLSSMPSS
jgi:hypothetical protein